MDDVTLHIDYHDVEAFFDYAGYKARNLSKPLNEARGIMLSSVEAAFDTEGDSTGEPWRQLSQDWAHRRGSEHPILEITRELRIAAELGFEVHSSAHEARIDYRVDVEYAAVQFFGGGPKRLPARPWLVATPEIQDAIEATFFLWLHELADGNRRRAAGSNVPGLPQMQDLVAW